MTFLVVDEDRGLARIRAIPDSVGGNVPAIAKCWHFSDPAKLDRLVRRLTKVWLSGNVHERGALFTLSQEEVLAHCRAVMGPSLHEQIERKKRPRPTVWPFVMMGISSLVLTLLWMLAKTLFFIALVPTLIFVFTRRNRW